MRGIEGAVETTLPSCLYGDRGGGGQSAFGLTKRCAGLTLRRLLMLPQGKQALATCNWGAYSFTAFDPEVTQWNDVGGVYIFARAEPGTSKWYAQYIGRTRSFSERLSSHEKWSDSVRLGSTHVHVLVEPNERQRGLIEQELIQKFDPPLNG